MKTRKAYTSKGEIDRMETPVEDPWNPDNCSNCKYAQDTMYIGIYICRRSHNTVRGTDKPCTSYENKGEKS